MSKYNKFILFVVGAAVVIIGRHFGQSSELYQDAALLATGLGVVVVPNTPASSSTSPSSEPFRPV